MLVLSRKVGNRIVIAGDIEVTIVQIRGNIVRLGVNAPRHISIERCDARMKYESIGPGQPQGIRRAQGASVPGNSRELHIASNRRPIR